MENAKISEIIFALEQIKEIYGDKQVYRLELTNNISEELLLVEFEDYQSHTIEVKTYDDFFK
ncbi:hypothetical protein [Clostridium cuniculi]|uniref:hypothetical protein n=1 Tax=Clostridium cuniculi TaxID=2548455 RepID=UPI0010550E20|nr:hypothetical protein [Clostridium cuniculi]